ncbi:predicted protein [Candida tropicalis MYA-3404]|uniref:ZZ-type domain-containing protein n=1 Tax=Candida tropicalis (strain ATCC MYA-3404 / T1) TaxID=294747 RepID=C5M8A5_CANTT|nr:predicted protein [Candida tropicalis MYA-3404]EER33809.1 predicted protein [Candida tropicalis MYA-3404]KAG4407659.1 hypothetical protein JTP64_003194 [Candida tropicalis]
MPPQNQSQRIIIKVAITKANTGSDSTPVEKTVYARRDSFTKIKSKAALTAYLSKELPDYISSDASYLAFTRKSKKYKDFISLDSEDDFKSLARSLKVKNHVKLNVVDSSPIASDADDSTRKRKSTTIDFGALGDALIEVAFEHFKEMFGDLSNGAPFKKGTSSVASDNSDCPSYNTATKDEASLPVHSNICCDVCHPDDFVPLRGVRYSCLVCPNFDLCSSCESRQLADKSSFGSHSYLHPMAKIIHPSSSFVRGGAWGSTIPQTNDIVYDIPLENCNLATKERLEELLKSKGFEGFVNDVDRYISDSEKYQKLCTMMEIEDEDEEVQFLVLMSILEHAMDEDKKEQDSDVPQSEPVTSDNDSVAFPQNNIEGEVIVRPKKFGEISRIISLQLTNNTNQTIEGGELKFEFFNSKQTETVVVRNASAIKPGRIRYYNLGRLAEEFERINGMQLRIVTEGAVFVGEYKDNSDSILTAQSSFEAKVPEVSEADDSGDTSATESIAEDENVLAKSELAEEHNSCGSTHSMVLPSLPKESTILASSEYYDATSDAADYSKKDSMVDDEDDYDIISGAEDEDTASDFEVLSAVSSNNQ